MPCPPLGSSWKYLLVFSGRLLSISCQRDPKFQHEIEPRLKLRACKVSKFCAQCGVNFFPSSSCSFLYSWLLFLWLIDFFFFLTLSIWSENCFERQSCLGQISLTKRKTMKETYGSGWSSAFPIRRATSCLSLVVSDTKSAGKGSHSWGWEIRTLELGDVLIKQNKSKPEAELAGFGFVDSKYLGTLPCLQSRRRWLIPALSQNSYEYCQESSSLFTLPASSQTILNPHLIFT